MGNIPNQIHERNSTQVEELIGLMKLGPNHTSYQLSFDSFQSATLSKKPSSIRMVQYDDQTFPIPQSLPLFDRVLQNATIQEVCVVQKGTVENMSKNTLKAKRAIIAAKILKIKKVKKIKKPEEQTPQMTLEQQQELRYLEQAQMSTAPDKKTRGQNDCKTYNRLVKNILLQNKCVNVIMKHHDYFSNRFYFVIALILIKFYVDENFTQAYSKIVAKEINAQQKKMDKKIFEKVKILKRIKEMKKTQQNTDELKAQLFEIEKQIDHIEMVKHEIQDFSMRSCAAFFQGDIEESLKILYKKDDAVMRKKKRFQDGLKIVLKLQAQVRQAFSRQSDQ